MKNKPFSSEPEPSYNLRKRQHKSVLQYFNIDGQQLNEAFIDSQQYREKKSKGKKKRKNSEQDYDGKSNEESEVQSNIFDDNVVFDRLPEGSGELKDMLYIVKLKIKNYKTQFIKEQEQLKTKTSQVGQSSIPICADITKFNFDTLIKKQLEFSQSYFDVIMMDPPWKLSTSQPSRGVAIQYDSLNDQYIEKIPVPKLQKNGGLLIIWAINAKYAFTINLMEKVWGYKVVDSITWIKKTINGKIAKGHGFYLQHAKQTCLVGVKGDLINAVKGGVAKDIIFSERRGQSQKPTEIYDFIETLIPKGHYLQIFGRRNNLRNGWVTIGNEL